MLPLELHEMVGEVFGRKSGCWRPDHDNRRTYPWSNCGRG